MNANRHRALELLRVSLANCDAQFHEHQWEAISQLVEDRRRVLVVERTGWGKSAVYFIAAKLLREQGFGPTLIVSPLLALMRNQVALAARYGVRLSSLNSSNSQEENETTEQDLLNDHLDALIVSPEQLAKERFREDVLQSLPHDVALFVIDEAHCISDWGHDFRPDYKRIITLLGNLPANMPVLATTATANQRVMVDVAAQLGSDIQIIRGPLTRESLHLQNLWFPQQSQRLAWLAEMLPRLQGTGVIYTATTHDAELVASWLQSRELNVQAYYGTMRGMSQQQSRLRRIELEAQLFNNELKALVATSALGMGYNKPDLAFVVHFQSPGSVVSYYQQVGRAGRDIPKAYGILLSGKEDDRIQQYFIDNAFPAESLIQQILQVVEDSEDGLTVNQIEQCLNVRRSKVEAALKFLAAESPAPILVQRNPVRYQRTLVDYQLPTETIERLSNKKRDEWAVMQDYLSHKGCLMQFLARELDDAIQKPCEKCANCAPEQALPVSYGRDIAVAAGEFIHRSSIPIPPKAIAESGRTAATARFPIYQFPYYFSAENLKHEAGRALCRWGEAGWGELAMQQKHDGFIGEPLVDASARMITEQWTPDPAPQWVTCVPSCDHPELVKQFAHALADRLKIPCYDVLTQAKPNRPQKTMENAFHRCRNLDGRFEVFGAVQDTPVLLVDDAVDSGWTFAVLAALLLRAGSGPVFPFAIMSTSSA
jgi:ATP-dependent DNA helicase RecQ